jgi:NAD(P)-dependent dehydrogenase (short-subunit alcohol dehydrogenase family)
MSKRVLITGSRGIAAGLATELAKSDYQIYLLGGDAEDSKSLAAQLPAVLGYEPIDLRDELAVVNGFQEAIKSLGGLDHVVSIAGGSGRAFGDGPIESISKNAWEQTLELNLTTAFLTAREAVKYFKESGGGSLTLTSSVLATSPSPEFFQTNAYAVAKGAINAMVATLSSSYLANKIRVNAVAPSLVATPMAKRAAENPEISEFTKRKQPRAPNQLPVGQVVAGYVYLIENNAVTGQVLEIDGGWSTISGI